VAATSAGTAASPLIGPGPPRVPVNVARVARSSSNAPLLAWRIARSDRSSGSGGTGPGLLSTCRAAPAFMLITARPWPTTSCTSWAIRSRSS
jgi:hypothetical protein